MEVSVFRINLSLTQLMFIECSLGAHTQKVPMTAAACATSTPQHINPPNYHQVAAKVPIAPYYLAHEHLNTSYIKIPSLPASRTDPHHQPQHLNTPTPQHSNTLPQKFPSPTIACGN